MMARWWKDPTAKGDGSSKRFSDRVHSCSHDEKNEKANSSDDANRC